MSRFKRKLNRFKTMVIFCIILALVVGGLKIVVREYQNNTSSVESTAAALGVSSEELKDFMAKANDVTHAYDSITAFKSKIVNLFVNAFISLGDVSEAITEPADDETLGRLKSVVVQKLTDLKLNLSETDINGMADEITGKIAEKMSADSINSVLESGNVDSLFTPNIANESFISRFLRQFIDKMRSQMNHMV